MVLRKVKMLLNGGKVAGDARKNIEKESGRPIITKRNAKTPELLDDK